MAAALQPAPAQAAGENIAAEKSAFRRDILARRAAMGAAARRAASAAICEKIFALPAYQKAAVIAGFAPMAEEADIWPVLEDAAARGKTVALPRVVSAGKMQFHLYEGREKLTGGYKNIPEPRRDAPVVSAQKFDVVMVPAVAVGKNGTRLGYGGGFYDILLPDLAGAVLFSPVFRCQSVQKTPSEAHDRRVHFIITEE